MQETAYKAYPYLFQSKGLIARWIQDRAPEYTYLNLNNADLREEAALSSRYGTLMVTRDAVGTGTTNHPFSAPVTTLARLVYNQDTYRYAGLTNGQLYRKTGDSQGAYTQISTATYPLSGEPFQWVVASCFETSQPYLFIADSLNMLKDNGTLTNPELWGIDPPAYQNNSQPYSPLLLMIDPFASSSTYATVNVTSWGWGPIETLTATSGQTITDFSQFYGIAPSGGGGSSPYYPTSQTTSSSSSQTGVGSTTTYSPVISGFSSVVPTTGETVTLFVTWSASGNAIDGGVNSVTFEWSGDAGSTWASFAGAAGSTNFSYSNRISSTTVTVGNLSQLQVRVKTVSSGSLAGSSASCTGSTSVVYATITAANAFGPVVNGMLSLLDTQPTVNVSTTPIANVTVTNLVGGLYENLLVTTQTNHGLSAGNDVAIYASSNDLLDGFYSVSSVPSATQFTVPYVTATELSATGGYITGGASTAPACVLTDQYSSPYPTQITAYGFYQQVPTTTTSFPLGAFSGTVNASTTGTVTKSVTLDLSQNNQVTDDDLIILTFLVDNPNNVSQVELRFYTGSGTNNYYTKFISPAYYQAAVSQAQDAYTATQQQIFADSLNLVSGQQPGSTSAQLQPANLSTGNGSWAACYLRRGDFLPVGQAGQAGVDWAAITGWEILLTTASSTVNFSVNGLYLQWGYGPSSFGGTGYSYRQTYYDANTGTESSPNEEQSFNSTFGYLSSENPPFYLRQAVQVTGQYSSDSQTTHVRQYRRGGSLPQNWVMVAQIPNITGGGTYFYKDVVADAFIQQAKILVLDNDPPVTSSLVSPIQTQLSQATSGPGNFIYQTFSPQTITTVQQATYVPNQIVQIGYASNLEAVMVIQGGTGQFTAITRLQHNAGEPVNVYAVPRQPCDLVAAAYGQLWLAGDKNNPGYLYFSKPGQPENFGPENYLNVSSPSDPIMAVINWRGTLYVATLTTWYLIQGGANPIAQPTGSKHGMVAKQGWTQTEYAIWYRSNDGLRAFTGAEGEYMSLPIEFIFRDNALTPVPVADNTLSASTVMAFYNNEVFCSYIAQDGNRYRLIWHEIYRRYRNDSLPVTAMLWEQDTNTFLGAYNVSGVGNSIVQDMVYTMDYDDGGWSGTSLVKLPITVTIQVPYQDLGTPHNDKQFNILEVDANTQGQILSTTLYFDDGQTVLTLPTTSSTQRSKLQLPVNAGLGQQAYRMSLQHEISVTSAPIFYQSDIYAAELAAYRYSWDTYWILGNTDLHKTVKECLFDYTSTVSVTFSCYADNSSTPYYSFTLPAAAQRAVIRVRFPALRMRTFRLVGNVTSGDEGMQMWSAPQLRWKTVLENSGYQNVDLVI